MSELNFGTGRIGEVINALKEEHGVEDVSTLSEKVKLSALLECLQLEAAEFDELISGNSPVFRTVKGHAFESVFKYILEDNGVVVTSVGGDDAVDQIVNKTSLQLKTPNMAGTKGVYVQYKTHKTHGAKSERESMDYYHSISHFADLLVGLVSYEPLKVLLLNHSEIPRHPKDNSKIQSPFTLTWYKHPALNAFQRIGVSSFDEKYDNHIPSNATKECLPKTSSILNLKSEIILDTILMEENFRIWDMSIRGFAREVAITRMLKTAGVSVLNPVSVRPERGDKADFAVRVSSSYVFFQVKGVSTSNCRFDGQESIVGTETQLTRGRVNDHPTQSRLYLNTDFDYLILALDPPLVKRFESELGNDDEELRWAIYCIPTANLRNHPDMPHRINAIQRFRYQDLKASELNSSNIGAPFISSS
jgi:hypothetical protein